ncbi:MAG: T9SS type A sorting domain-containing protein, partial [Ignavibacteria bacterium]
VPGCSPNSNCYRGDYTGITGNPLTSFSIWSDHRNGNALNMGAYLPDFAMRVRPDSAVLNNMSDSSFHYAAIPGVKLWNRTTKFSASVTPTPPAGTITLTLLDKTLNIPRDSLTVFPDSLRLRVKTSGGVTPGVYTVSIKGNGTNGTPVHRRMVTLTVSDFTGISYLSEVPGEFYLYQNYPNPFNPITKIRFDIPAAPFSFGEGMGVRLVIYDILGREVAVLVNEELKPGGYEAEFDGRNFPSGIYFYKLTAREYTETRKMALVK